MQVEIRYGRGRLAPEPHQARKKPGQTTSSLSKSPMVKVSRVRFKRRLGHDNAKKPVRADLA